MGRVRDLIRLIAPFWCWQRTNDSVVQELEMRLAEIPKPACAVVRHCLRAVRALIDLMVFPNRGQRMIPLSGVKNLDSHKIRCLYGLLLRHYATTLPGDVGEVVEPRELEWALATVLGSCSLPIKRPGLSSDSIWERVCQVSGIERQPECEQRFQRTAAHLYAAAISQILAQQSFTDKERVAGTASQQLNDSIVTAF